ncbi:SusC/RagA family TonB-linked outer membrane protein [Pedobacter faecalis]|uniref:SusC/RagA family TonB-linked outer membrane protein n=1 Tax=Pedobacter faecalis TaxID=3041495 RepID=UPI00254F0D38|nr:SusC/RagA family TonB-linked outer membrane protein [Pedobacter sp. ELA7]
MKLTFLYNPVSRIQRVKYKILIAMKLTAILLLLGTMHLSAAVYSQNITLSRRNATLESLFNDVKKQTGYLFFYNGKINTKNRLLNVELKNVPLEEALQAFLDKQDLTYKIVDRTIVIMNEAQTMNQSLMDQINARRLEITGKVLDGDTKEGMPGVNISLKSTKATLGQTNGQGEFKINAQAGDVIVFTYVGYKPYEVKVSDAKRLNIVLEPLVNSMDNVVITGYQTIKKESYTDNAVTVTGEELKRVNPLNLLQSIQAFDPSFRLMENNLGGSDPNRLPNINVRGSSALPSGDGEVLRRDNITSTVNMPAFILDGFQVDVQKIFDLDINRVASVTLLKDAAATAIYGSRAANGVLVITTKAPQEGSLRITYNAEGYVSTPDLSDYQVLNASEKLQYEQLAGLYSSNVVFLPQDELDELYYSKLRNVVGGVDSYWLSQPVRTTAGQKHSVNLEGGSETFRYGVDLRYQARPGVMKGSSRDQYSGGMTFMYNKDKLLLRNDLLITQMNAKESPYGSFANYVRMNPYYPIRDADGRVLREVDLWEDQARNEHVVLNPLYDAGLSSFNKSAYTEIINNLSGDYELSNSLRLRGQMSLTTRSNSDDIFKSPMSNEFYFYESTRLDEKGSYTDRHRKETYWDGNIRLTWFKQLDGHAINLLGGVNARTELSDEKEYTAVGFANDRFTSIGFARGYAENATPLSGIRESRLLGSFMSLNYSYQNKYLLDATGRLDGSSKFGNENRTAPFWSLGLGWNVHNEKFLAGHPVISQLRVRASTGLTGSVEFEPYLSRTTYNYQNGNWYSSGIGAIVNNYGNSALSWQKTQMTDIGIEVGLFKDRIFVSPRVYRKFTKDILADITLPPSTGFYSYKENLGDMENKGAELNLRADAVREKDWTVSLTANLVANRNQIVRISNALKKYNDRANELQTTPTDQNGFRGIPLLRYNEGQSINAIYAVPSLGIDPENGRELYRKRDGSLTYTYDVNDVVVVGNSDPKVNGFFGGTVRYKNFLMTATFESRFGGDMYNNTLVDRVENADARYNVDRRVFDEKWKQSGDLVFYKNIADRGETQVNSRFVMPDNMINLQSVYLSYDFEKRVASRLKMSALRFAVTANDLARWSSVKQERGIDYPFARSINFSINAIF